MNMSCMSCMIISENNSAQIPIISCFASQLKCIKYVTCSLFGTTSDARPPLQSVVLACKLRISSLICDIDVLPDLKLGTLVCQIA